MVRLRRLAAPLLLCVMALPASAHLLNMSKSTLRIEADGAVEAVLELDLLLSAGSREAYYQLSRRESPLSDPDVLALLAPLPEALDLRLDGAAVALEVSHVQFSGAARDDYLDPLSWPRTKLRLRGQLPATPGNGSVLWIVYGDAFRFEEPIANTFVDAASGRTQTRWLVTGQRSPRFVLAREGASAVADPAQASSADAADEADALDAFRNLLNAGFRHIFPGGADHLLFVAALFFGSASLGGLVAIVTVFTLAHSLSLALTALGWFSVAPAIVEPLILLSILWVSAMNLRAARRGNVPAVATRYTVVLLFGLVHGLGFAAALRDIGLPVEHLLTGLVAFNLGVELAQLVFLFALAATVAALAGIARRLGTGGRPHWNIWGSAAVSVATAVLIVQRLLAA